MPLTESEELELLELENENAVVGNKSIYSPAPSGEMDFKTIAMALAHQVLNAAKAPAKLAEGMAPGFVRGLGGQKPEETAPFPEKLGAEAVALLPAAGAVALPLLAPGVGIVGSAALAGLGAGGAEAGKQLLGRALGAGGPDTPADATVQIGTQAALNAIGTGAATVPQAFIKANRKELVRLGAQLIRTTAAVPEKYGQAVLENLDILTKAPTMEIAQKIYRSAVQGLPGARKYLQLKTGNYLMSGAPATEIFNTAMTKLEALKGEVTKDVLSLPEALAAEQSATFLLNAAKYGNAEQLANAGALKRGKEMLSNYLEEGGLAGFNAARKSYFEANAREAFKSLLPLNKNMSPNVLRSLGGLAELSAGAILKAPFVVISAMPFSPKMWGYALRAADASSNIINTQSAKFAANIIASRTARK